MAETSVYSVNEPYRSTFESISSALDAVVTSDLLELKKVWQDNYDELLKIEPAQMLYNFLIAKKDWIKAQCIAGVREEYIAGRKKISEELQKSK